MHGLAVAKKKSNIHIVFFFFWPCQLMYILLVLFFVEV